MNPQWNTVFATSKTTPKRSLASADRPILMNIFFLLSSNAIEVNDKSQSNHTAYFMRSSLTRANVYNQPMSIF